MKSKLEVAIALLLEVAIALLPFIPLYFKRAMQYNEVTPQVHSLGLANVNLTFTAKTLLIELSNRSN